MSDDKPINKVREHIDANLRRVFDEHANEELPDRFKDLLTRLRSETDSPAEEDKA